MECCSNCNNQKKKNPFGPNDATVRGWLIIRGAFGAAAVMAWFFGIQILPLPTAVTLQFTTPPFAAAFAVLLVEVIDGDNVDAGVLLKALAVMVTTEGAMMAGIAYVCVRKIGDAADAVVMVFYYGALSLPMTAIGSKLYLNTWNVLGDFQHFSLVDYFLLLLVGFAGYGEANGLPILVCK